MSDDPRARFDAHERLLRRPTFTLLRGPQAPVVLTVLAEAFDDGAPSVSADRMHGIVDRVRAQAGVEVQRSAREECDRWLRGGTRWLTRFVDPASGEEHYRLTDDADEALAFVASQTRDRVVTTGSTVAALMEQAHRTALHATTDPAARRDLLAQRREALARELAQVDDELADIERTGTVVPADDEAVHNDYLLLVQQVQSLLRDLRLVAGEVREVGDDLREEFRTEDHPTGRIIDEYLQRLTVRLTATRHGQGFEGAKRLLEDPASRARLRADLATILDHPFAARLSRAEVSAARRMVSAIHQATGAIFDERTRINTALTGYVQARHATTGTGVPRALTDLDAALRAWEAGHRRRDTLPAPAGLPRAQVATLRLRAGRVTERATPPPVAARPAPVPLGAADLERLRAKGGPRYRTMVDTLEGLLADGGPVTGADLFAALDPADRRPVDLVGMLTLAAGAGSLGAGHDTVPVTAHRPDGTTRTLLVPAITFTQAPALPVDLLETR